MVKLTKSNYLLSSDKLTKSHLELTRVELTKSNANADLAHMHTYMSGNPLEATDR